MSTAHLARSILAAALGLALRSTMPLQAAQTNASVFADLPYALTLNREVDFMRLLLEETNKNFDQKVYASVVANGGSPIVVSYSLVSFVFHYPGEHCPRPVCYRDGAAGPTGLHQRGCPEAEHQGRIRRTTSAYPIRTARKSMRDWIWCFPLLPLANRRKRSALKGSFQFVYRNGWKEQ